MVSKTALDILKSMLDSIDPISGEILPKDHLCNYPEVMRALHAAILVMTPHQVSNSTLVNKKNKKLNAGRPWTEEDTKMLERLYVSGVSVDTICTKLQRRERGIRKQLMYLGLIESETQPARKIVPGLERAGLPWQNYEDVLLSELYNKKLPISEIASELHRSEYSIFCRLENKGLFSEEYDYPSDRNIKKWTYSDIRQLRDMFNEGKTIAELAEYFNVPEKYISARLFYMKLTNASPF